MGGGNGKGGSEGGEGEEDVLLRRATGPARFILLRHPNNFVPNKGKGRGKEKRDPPEKEIDSVNFTGNELSLNDQIGVHSQDMGGDYRKRWGGKRSDNPRIGRRGLLLIKA